MNKTLKLWKVLFGENLTPNDSEIIGVEPDGTVIHYKASDGSCYNIGMTVDVVDDNERRLNEREHIVTHPLQYVVLLRMQLQACLSPDGSTGMKDGLGRQKARLLEINTIVERALSADPNRYVDNLKKEAEFQRMKKQASPPDPKPGKNSAADHAMMTNEPFLRGDNGRTLSRAAFEERCYILRTKNTTEKQEHGKRVLVRKFAVYFGHNKNTGTWKYAIGIYCNTREEAIGRAFDAIKLWALNRSQAFARFHDEYYDVNFNRKLPLSF